MHYSDTIVAIGIDCTAMCVWVYVCPSGSMSHHRGLKKPVRLYVMSLTPKHIKMVADSLAFLRKDIT